MCEYYWLDINRLNEIYRYKGEEFGEAAMNKFNIYPDSIPYWLTEWLPGTGGYGSRGAGRIDFLLCLGEPDGNPFLHG